MKIISLSVFLFLGVLLFIYWDNFLAPELFPWQSDYRRALSQAQQQHKPILIFFSHLNTCQWCRAEFTEQLTTLSFKRWARRELLLVHVDGGSESSTSQNWYDTLSKRFNVNSSPSLLLLDENEQVIWRQEGYTVGQDLKTLLTQPPTPSPPPKAGLPAESST